MGRDSRKRERNKHAAQRGGGTEHRSSASMKAAPLADRRHLWLALIFVLALALRCLYLWGQYQHNPFFFYPPMDEGVHHAWAQQIANGEGMGDRPYVRAPLYYYLLGLLYAVAGPKIWLARLAGCVLGALNCYLIGRLGIALGELRVGLVAGVLAALYWPAIYFDAELLTVGLEVTLSVGLLWALIVAGRRDSVGGYALAGVLWGLAAITRPNILAFAPVIWLWAWLSSSRQASAVRRLRGAAIATALAGVVILPVTLRNLIVGHEFVPIASSAGINLYIGNNPEANGYVANVPGARPTWKEWIVDIRQIAENAEGRELSDREVSSYWAGRAFGWMREQPGAWAALMFRKLGLFWNPLEIPNNQSIWFLARRSAISVIFWIGFPVVATLALPALVLIGRRSRDWLVPALFLLVNMLVVIMFFCPARFRMPIVPVLIVAAAAGLVVLYDWWRQRQFKLIGAYAGIAVVVAIIIAMCPPSRAEFRALAESEGHYHLARLYATPAPDGPEDLDKAVAEYREAVRLDPTSTHRRVELAGALLRQKDYAGAASEYAQVIARQPAAETRLKLARCLLQLGNARDAIEQLKVVLAHDPDSASASRLMGEALVAAGDYASAVHRLRAAAEADPDIDTRYNLAAVLLRMNQVSEAITILEGILSEAPGNGPAAQNLGVAYARLGDLEHAAGAFEKATQADPSLIEAHINWARALGKLGRPAEQKRVLEQAVQVTAAEPQVTLALAWLLATSPE
ncbi:MAG: tetratricopeptide repeat protein, partial [Phycisphaerae bacterium]|nr:tetratricopeptide repeat protein [Phycisphaerae bacterium]